MRSNTQRHPRKWSHRWPDGSKARVEREYGQNEGYGWIVETPWRVVGGISPTFGEAKSSAQYAHREVMTERRRVLRSL